MAQGHPPALKDKPKKTPPVRVGRVPAAPRYYTTPPTIGADQPGLVVKFAAHKGYYVTAKPAAKPAPTTFHVPTPPRPSYNAQQQSLLDAWNIVNPQIDAARAAALAQTNAGMGAIKGYTQFLANALSQYNPGDIYQRAQDTLSGIGQNVQSSLAGAGSQLQGQLAQALGAINAPAETQQFANLQGQIGAQSGATQSALGSADLAAITKSRAAAENYAAQLPGIAGFAGLQSARSLQLQQQAALTDTVNKLIAQVPQLQQQRYQDIKANQAAQATSQQKLAQQKFDNMLATQAFGLKSTTAKSTAASKAADRKTRSQIAAANNATRLQVAQENNAAKKAAAAQKRADAQAKAQETARKQRSDWFDKQRAQAVKDAQVAFAAGHKRVEVVAYLRSAYGRLLIGHGFTQPAVDAFVKAVADSGQANPQAASSGRKGTTTTGPKTTVGQQAAGIFGATKAKK